MLASHYGELSRWLDPDADPQLVETALQLLTRED